RTFQKADRTDEPLDAYAQVTNVDDVAVDGVSAALVARYARCRLFEKHNRPDDLRAEAQELDLALHAGRCALLARVSWLYSADAAKWSGRDQERWRDGEALAVAVGALWDEWRAAPPHAASGRESIDVNGVSMTVSWQSASGEFRALIAGPRFVE